jgi:signal transduction histidine kinase
MKSIRRQLTLSLVSVLVAWLGGGGLLVYFSTRAALVAQVDARLRVEALAVVKQTKQERDDGAKPAEHKGSPAAAPAGRELEVGFTDKYMPEFDQGGTEFFQVWSPDSKTVKRSASLGRAELPRRAGALERPAFWSLVLPSGGQARAIGMTFVPPSPEKERKWHDPNFQATIVVASELGALNKTLAALRAVLFSVGALGLLATLVIVPWLMRRGLLPLARVADHASTLEAATLQARFPTETMPAELRPICQRLNELLGRLEQSFQRERRFSADVAHELRTPIAELRSLAEVALKWPQGTEAKTQAFQDALAIARQMEGIVTSLLAITRCEAGQQATHRETLNVAQLVQEHWHPFAPQAEEKKLQVIFQVPPESQIHTDRGRFGLILTNLFSNAADYTPVGGTVEVGFSNGRLVTLSVSNSTDNLRPDDLPQLFERFWRKDNARSASLHAGLGLALSKAYAEVLGMQLTPELTVDGRLRISVALEP